MSVLNLFIALAICSSVLFLIDYIVYTIKSASKSTTMTDKQWAAGFISTCFIVYLIVEHFSK